MDRNSLSSVVKICSKIVGVKQSDQSSFSDQQIAKKSINILNLPEHLLVLYPLYCPPFEFLIHFNTWPHYYVYIFRLFEMFMFINITSS